MTERILKVGIDPSKAESGARRARSAMDEVKKGARGASDSVRNLDDRFEKAKSQMLSFKGVVAGLGLGLLAKQVLDTASAFEQYRIQLETVTGSAIRANRAFAGIKEFAQNTPFAVKNITEAFIQLKAVGIQPTEDLLKSIGDTAAAFGKDITQFSGAVIGAATGEFERLKQFGIVARNLGDEIKVITKNGVDFIANNAQSITKYLEEFGKNNFAEAAKKQVDTFAGAISNLGDNFDALIDRALNTSGSLDFLASGVRSVSDVIVYITKNFDDLSFALEIATKASLGLVAIQLPTYIAASASAVKALTLAIASNPIGLLLTSVAGIVGLLISFKEGLQDVTKNTISLRDIATAAWQLITEALDEQLAKIQKFIDLIVMARDAVFDFAKSAADFVKRNTGIDEFIGGITDQASSAVGKLAERTDQIAAIRIEREKLAAATMKEAEAQDALEEATFNANVEADKQIQAQEMQTKKFNEAIKVMDEHLSVLSLQSKGRERDADLMREQIRLTKDLGRELEDNELRQLKERIDKQAELNEQLEKQKDLTEESKKAAEAMQKPFIDAADRIQEGFADAFTKIFNNGVKSFKDMGNIIKQAFSRMLGELATIAIQRQIIIPMQASIGGMMGMGGVSTAGASGGMGGLGGIGQIAQLSGLGGNTGILAGLGTSIATSVNSFGASIGFGGVTPSFIGPLQAGTGVGANAGALTSASLGSVLGAAGLGYVGGGFLGQIGGNSQNGSIGGTIGAGLGMAVGGPIGALIGGAIGGLAGGFVGGGKSNNSAGINFDPFTGQVFGTGQKNGTNVGGRDALFEAVLQSVGLLQTATGATGGVREINIDVGSRDGIKFRVGNRSGSVGVGQGEEALSVITELVAQQLTGIPSELERAIDVIDFSDLESALNQLQFAAAYVDGSLFETTDQLTQAEQAIRSINAQFDEFSVSVSALGLNMAKLEQERQKALQALTTGFDEEIQMQILNLTDPLQAQMDALLDAQEERVKEAQALGANLVEVERLNMLEREKFLEGYMQNVRDYVDNLAITGGGLNTPAETLANMEALFNETITSALGGDQNAVNNITSIADQFLAASTAFFGSSQGYVDDLGMVTSQLEGLIGSIPQFAGGGITSGISFAGEQGPEAVVPLPDGRTIPVQIAGNFGTEIVQELRRLGQMLQSMERQGQSIQREQADDIKDMSQSLSRLASNIEAGGY